jgi:hypothetical protein
MAESEDSGKQMARAERGVRCTTKHRRFLTLYTVPADSFMSIDFPGRCVPGDRIEKARCSHQHPSIRLADEYSALADKSRQSKPSFSS